MIKIAVISNICFEPYLKNSFSKAFSGDVQTSYLFLNNVGEIRTVDADFVLLHLSYERLVGDKRDVDINAVAEECENIYKSIKKKTLAQILWLGFDDYGNYDRYVYGNVLHDGYFADRLNPIVAGITDESDGFIDFKRIVAEIGINDAYCDKGKYRWNSPYSEKTVDCIAAEVYTQYLITYGKTKKCLVLDCDGVFWNGILSEDGTCGIDISEKYAAFQKFVLQMYKSGVILCLCTKNREEELSGLLRNHRGMILGENNFALIMANFKSKAENMNEIIGILNISPESIVFVDDSENEISEMQHFFPEIRSILFDPITVYKELSCFKLRYGVSETAEIRTENYRKKATVHDLPKTDGKTEIHPAAPDEIKRISDLSMRTNRKTNGVRMTVGNLAQEGREIYAVYYSDDISDYGLIGAMVTDGETLELFSLSCRVIGKEIEKKMAEYLKDNRQIKKIECSNTGKNKDFCDWLKSELL